MSVLGEKDSAIVKQLDAGLKCSWNWSSLKLEGKAMVLGTLVEHSIPFSRAPVIVELAQTLSLDKPALQGMKLSRTTASYKMIHGLVYAL
ncbi:hypothetical protein KUCAC02_005273 [Chaenocephalus aceratus]|uniref:Uncharacterized protein n=1 Tax=Chaenocephalus aceratus TaxID=36190 RepID=A0ACB9WMX5_CHAAC|nr:hypothetical protein KUCAC02_005273 [Chaenocephalus aceratus]